MKAADGVKKATDEVKKVGLSLLTQLSIGDRTRASLTAENALGQGDLPDVVWMRLAVTHPVDLTAIFASHLPHSSAPTITRTLI